MLIFNHTQEIKYVVYFQNTKFQSDSEVSGGEFSCL